MIRVVFAEDHALVREGIVALLSRVEAIRLVAVAAEGTAALALIRKEAPDVALLDVRMPGLSGIEVTAALRKEGKTTPVLLLTTFDDEDALRAAAMAGAQGYMRKDARKEALVEALELVARGGTMFAPWTAGERHEGLAKCSFPASEIPEPLSAREKEVLRLMAAGLGNREIARVLHLAEGTVKNHTSSIYSKLGVRDRTRAVLKCVDLGWL